VSALLSFPEEEHVVAFWFYALDQFPDEVFLVERLGRREGPLVLDSERGFFFGWVL
jgi:hypothetical protein